MPLGGTIKLQGESEYRRALSQIKQNLREVSSEMKIVTSTYDKNDTSTKALSAKSDVLSKRLEEQKSKLKLVSDQYKQYQDAVKKSADEHTQLGEKLENAKTKLASIEAQSGKNTKEYEEQKKVVDDLQKQYDESTTAQDKNKKSLSQLAVQMNNAEADVIKTTKEIDKLGKESDDSAKQVDDLSKNMGDTDDASKKLNDGFTVLKGTLANLVTSGIQKVGSSLISFINDSSNAYAQFSAQTGIATDKLGGYKKAIDNVYKNNFGESLADVAEQMGKVKEVTGELDPSKLESMTEKAMTLEDVFGMDMTETIRGAQALMNHFGITGEQAFDLMSAGAQNGLNYTDELGDNISEYSGKFAEAGYSAKDYFQLLQNGSQGGSYNLDKVNDAINEVTTRLGDGTIKESLSDFSKNTQNVFKEWQNGRATQKDVIDSIVKDINKTKNQQDKLNLATTAFGTMAEDGGTKFVSALSSVGNKYDDVQGKADKLANTKYDTPTSALQGLGRTVQMDLLKPLSDDLMPYINKMVNYLNKNMPKIKSTLEKVGSALKKITDAVSELSPLIVGLGVSFGTLKLMSVVGSFSNLLPLLKKLITSTKLYTIAQGALNLVMDANPIMLVTSAIIGLVAGFVLLWNKSEAFRKFWIGLWEGIKTACKGAVDKIKKFFTEDIPNAIDKMINFFKKLPSNVEKELSKVIDKVTTWASKMASKALSAGKKFVDNVIENVTQLPSKISTKLNNVITNVTSWASKMASKALSAGKKFVSNVINAITNLPSKVATLLSNVITKVTSWASKMASKALSTGKKFVTNVINAITNLPSKVATILSNVISKVTSWASNMASKGAEGARRLVTAVVNGVTSLPGKMLSIGGHIVTGLWNGISDKVGWITSQIRGFGDKVMNAMKSIFGIHSPSKRMKDEVGAMLVKGVVEGVKEEQGKAIKDINSAQESSLKKLYKKRDEIQSKLEDSSTQKSKAKRQQYKEQLEKVNDQIAESQKKHNDKVEKQEEKFSDQLVKEAKTRVEQLEKQNKINEAQEISYWKAVEGYCKKGSDAYNKAATQLASAKAKLKSDVSDLTKSYVTETAKVNEELSKNIEELKKTYSEAISQRQSSITGTLKLFDSFKQDDSKSKEELSGNLQTQVNALAEWNNTLTSLENRLGGNTDLIKELDSMGVTSLDNLKALNSMSDAELANYVAMWKQKEAIAKDRAVKENETLKAETDKQIKELKAKAKKQINELTKTYKNNLKKLGVAMKKPSKDIGKQIMAGIEAGLKAGSGSLSAELSKQCKKLVAQAKKELKIHSPSRVFRDEVGAMITKGISTGMVDEMPHAEVKMKDSLNNLVNSMQDISTISTNFDTSSNISTNGNVTGVETSYNNIVNAFKDALSQMKIEMDDEEMGRFVDKTVTKLIYN